MKTIKFQRHGQQAKFIPDGLNYKGFLVGITSVGDGEAITKGGFNEYGEGETWEEYKSYSKVYLPYFDADLMTTEEKQTIKSKNYKNVDDVIKDGLSNLLVKFETNERYIVIDTEVEKLEKQKQEENAILNKEKAIVLNDAHFGLSLSSNLPKSVFDLIKPYGRYISAREIDDFNEDMDDFSRVGEGKYIKGWYFEPKAVEVLKSNGFDVIVK